MVLIRRMRMTMIHDYGRDHHVYADMSPADSVLRFVEFTEQRVLNTDVPLRDAPVHDLPDAAEPTPSNRLRPILLNLYIVLHLLSLFAGDIGHRRWFVVLSGVFQINCPHCPRGQ
eukprot:6480432-Amphidinium_carterae.1